LEELYEGFRNVDNKRLFEDFTLRNRKLEILRATIENKLQGLKK
jgi:hypothetical protein